MKRRSTSTQSSRAGLARPRAGLIDQQPDRLVDAALVGAIGQHDHTALADAYAQHGGRVHALARGLCGQVRAEDLTQEIFLKLWTTPDGYKPELGSLRSYLLMQAHGGAVDMLRSDNARATREAAHDPEVNDRPATDAAALASIERADVAESVRGLPDPERQAIVLAYFGGHTYCEVAQLLATPEGTIKSRIRSGLRRLRVVIGTDVDLH